MQIFLSYSWDDKDLANDLEKSFATRGIALIKGTKNMHYKIGSSVDEGNSDKSVV